MALHPNTPPGGHSADKSTNMAIPDVTSSVTFRVGDSAIANNTLVVAHARKHLSNLELHFIVVGALFAAVVVLALANLYIHYCSGRRSRFLSNDRRIGQRSLGGDGGGGGKKTYTVKMKGSSFV